MTFWLLCSSILVDKWWVLSLLYMSHHIYIFACSSRSSNFCCNFRVLWGVSKKSWKERYKKISFMHVCKYLNQKVRKGEYIGKSFKSFSKQQQQQKNITQFKILSFYYCLLVEQNCLEKFLKAISFSEMHMRVKMI